MDLSPEEGTVGFCACLYLVDCPSGWVIKVRDNPATWKTEDCVPNDINAAHDKMIPCDALPPPPYDA